ncbi:MAG TPA: DUF2961 domain-containing protein [Planctomycetota bacterium]|nr:DUF2961 domain-containing protein [Planctomycetota bacterium]
MIALLLCMLAQDQPLVPRIGQPWVVARDPDLGKYTSEKQQPVDFGVWQAADGTWQLWSCIRGTTCGGKTRLFHRWEGRKLTDADWAPRGIAMEADPSLGETQGGLQAPYAIRHDGLWHLFYGDWENIRRATSTDGKTFERNPRTPLYAEAPGANTRDAMVVRAGDRWICYATAHPDNKGAVYARVSTDLVTWTDPKIVSQGGAAGDGPYSAECPFVVFRKGHWYLFRTQKYGKNAQTTVYRSRDPLAFADVVCTLPIAAPEILEHDGREYIAYLLPSLKGIQIAPLTWEVERKGATAEPPTIPVGLDAYRQWDRWPVQRIGARGYMRSTYDRKGGNESADASHFLYQERDDFNVTLDVAGPGVLAFARYNHWHGSPWHYEVDGTDHIVQESSSADPTRPVQGSVFLPEELFPGPLAWTWSTTQGADLTWVPIPFETSFRMAYTRTRYGTGYYIYHQFVRGIPLSQPIKAWDRTAPGRDVLELINKCGSDIAPPGDETSGSRIDLAGPSTIRAIRLDLPKARAMHLERARLRITWDGRDAPSVDAPLALFFGAGTFYNRDGREWIVKAFPMNVRWDGDVLRLACYYPMPFFRSARVELVGAPGLSLTVRTEPLRETQVGYFHATYRDIPHPEPGHDMVLLDTRGEEGSDVWSGSFVGMSWIFSHRAKLATLEGDPRFFFDDARTPQACGTGTEEWGGGGDYWGGRNMTLPFAGHPAGARSPKEAKAPEDLVNSAYRFLLGDLFPFGRRAVIRLEHGGHNESDEHYESVVYWYGAPTATLVATDDLDVGDPASEKAHDYRSPEAAEPYALTSLWEHGPDTLRGITVQEPTTDLGRRTAGTSEFTLKLDPRNVGALIRRTLDYECPNQRAEVFVADVGSDDFRPAGIWYTAGANTCVYSDPKGELGATLHDVQTSNRRWRDDEFLVPRDLTEGRSAIRVRVRFMPVDRPLFPGTPFPGERAWTEFRYRAYAFVVP